MQPSLFESRSFRRIHFIKSGCWHWPVPLSHPPYRQLYERWVGQVPKSLVLDHLCRNRHCVNPEHLEPVSQRENIVRTYARANRVKREKSPV